MENTIRQPGLEVTTPPHDDRYYSDLEVPVGSGPETVKYDYRVNAPQVMDPPAPKSGLGMQLRRKRVIVAIILTVVAFVVGVAVGVTVGRKNNTSAVGGTASSDTGASKRSVSHANSGGVKFNMEKVKRVVVQHRGRVKLRLEYQYLQMHHLLQLQVVRYSSRQTPATLFFQH